MKHEYVVNEDNISLRPINIDDLQSVVLWRNKSFVRKWFINDNLIELEKQKNWFSRYLNTPNDYIFIIDEDKEFKQAIGMVALYNIEDDEAEFGRFFIGVDKARGKGLGTKVVKMVCQFAIQKLKIQKVYLEVLEHNIAAKSVYEKCGFRFCYKYEANNKSLLRMEFLKMDTENISVIGLGYVGLPLAVTFAERGKKVIGFDVNNNKVELYKQGKDPTNEIGEDRLKCLKNLEFTSNQKKLKQSRFHIIAVPTPITPDKVPNLAPVISATKIVGDNLIRGSIIVFESTVYPGVTEDICVPILEEHSGLIYKKDFWVGYSPERINPGDKIHTVDKIKKVVSGCDEKTLDIIAEKYSVITDAGVFRASSIKVAEAAKVIENSQRDINIAFINEIAIIFDKMGIDTREVLEAANTKWNFLNFTPGLVGGHCIGIDPYYLTYKAQQLDYRPEVILSGRRINDNMGKIIVDKMIKKLIENNQKVKDARVLVMGLTFKEDVPDLRNSKVKDIIDGLLKYDVNVIITDPVADNDQVYKDYNINQTDLENVKDIDAIIVCVAHRYYKEINIEDLRKYYNTNISYPVLIDVKGIYDKKKANRIFNYWRL
ncbi:nucleotide sugar dehydrogenase [Vallitalea sp.]|uniref:nucleotide sugar dehydrogenase n=1 Tax=Vallitalea sp. TaxID=1882829 RepID=UPI002ED159C9